MIEQQREESGKPNERMLCAPPLEAKRASKTNFVCVRRYIHTFLPSFVYSIAHQKDEHRNARKHVAFFFREDVCHFPPKSSRFVVFVVFGEIVRENEITSEPPTWQPKTTRE